MMPSAPGPSLTAIGPEPPDPPEAPAIPAAQQSDAAGQERPVTIAAGKPDAPDSDHDWPPSLETRISLEDPSSPKKLATQWAELAHETELSGPRPGGRVALVQVAPSSEV